MNDKSKLAPSTIGALSELHVVNDLLIRGFYVFRAVSPSCVCDLVAVHKSGECFRVEVKTGTTDASGKIRHSVAMHNNFDWMAIVSGNIKSGAKIYYVTRNGVGVFSGEDVSAVVLSCSGSRVFCSNLA